MKFQTIHTKNMKSLIILLILTSLIGVIAPTDIVEDNKTFVPTKEWQEIKKGQSIPPGLHVRMNLQTGKKEAKLLEEDPPNKESALTLTDNPSEPPSESAEASKVRLEEALKGIPTDDFEYSEEKIKEITKKFRSYETLKEDMASLNMGIKTDFEIMSELFAKYEEIRSREHSTSELKEILDAFREMSHQIDNANEFLLSGGLEKLILPNLKNQSEPEIKISAIRLLGTIIQNNPKGQIAAFEKNVGQLLLKSLSKSTDNNELSTTIFGLGGILRKFPIAQKEILNKPGLKLLVELLNRQAVDYKIKIKCLRLLGDLISDYNDAILDGSLDKIKQYNAADIKGRLSETDYCKAIDEIFTIYRKDFLESLYATEDILEVLKLSKDMCQIEWSESPILRHTLLVIKNHFDRIRETDTDLDKNDVASVVRDLEHLNEFLFGHIVIKDEL
ncbi:nucleotide exchange factor Sil1 [Culicoides brevitarsis]|uniref:nucleotide exchange factor Sil1 n=1 Tax=Culicoides brevitarsis TaxID=469753 RepID=UPI00307BE58F